MRKLIIGLSVAVATFELGLAIFGLVGWKSSPPQPHQESQATQLVAVRPQASFTEEVDLSVDTMIDDEPFSHKVKLSEDLPPMILLDLMEDIDGQEITIMTSDKVGEYRILQRYRTSMSVMGEGPHLDLVDWRHFDSDWIPLPRLDPRTFRTLNGEQMDSAKFPDTTKSDIINAVRRRAGDWPEAIELAKTCRGPNEYPCGVGISSLYFLVQRKVGSEWTDVGQMEVLIPMGC